MAGETLYSCRYAKHPTNAIAGVRKAGMHPATVEMMAPGDAGSTGPEDHTVTDRFLAVTLIGTDYAALLALVGAQPANLVIGTTGTAGASEMLTIKNVIFTSVPSEVTIPDKDAGDVIQGFAVIGKCNWGAEDTFATMIVAAADS